MANVWVVLSTGARPNGASMTDLPMSQTERVLRRSGATVVGALFASPVLLAAYVFSLVRRLCGQRHGGFSCRRILVMARLASGLGFRSSGVDLEDRENNQNPKEALFLTRH